jgi:UDP-glucuronate 4-epimerase
LRSSEAKARGEHRLLNIGDNCPVDLLTMITTLERLLGRTAIKTMLPMQPGDVVSTCANVDRLHVLTGYRPQVRLAEGLSRFVDWYLSYHGVDGNIEVPVADEVIAA